MKRMIGLALAIIMMLALSACGKHWTCGKCEKEFYGAAYEDGFTDDVMCEDCAEEYYWPLPYEQFKK